MISFAFTRNWEFAAVASLWGGPIRILFVNHTTWCINSICHTWGTRPFVSNDESRNNWLFGVLALGEGWHNNHHAFPRSAKHGLLKWQPDVSYRIIKLMQYCGLAWKINVPNADAMQRRLAQRDLRLVK